MGDMSFDHMVIYGASQDEGLEIELLAPIGGATVAVLYSEFSWQAFDGAAAYDIEVATDAGFTNIVLSDTGIAATTWTSDGLRYSRPEKPFLCMVSIGGVWDWR